MRRPLSSTLALTVVFAGAGCVSTANDQPVSSSGELLGAARPVPEPPTYTVPDAPSLSGLSRAHWERTDFIVSPREVEHFPTYRSEPALLARASDVQRGEYPTAPTAGQSVTGDSYNVQALEAVLMPLQAVADLALLLPRLVFTPPNSPVAGPLAPIDRVPPGQAWPKGAPPRASTATSPPAANPPPTTAAPPAPPPSTPEQPAPARGAERPPTQRSIPMTTPAQQIDLATGLPVGYAFKPDWEVSPRELADTLKRGLPANAVLLDCRRDDEFALNRLPGAVQIEMNQVERRADELQSDAGGRTHPIIVYCHHGRRSMQVTATLRALGFTNVKSLAGGIDAWSLSIDPTVPRY